MFYNLGKGECELNPTIAIKDGRTELWQWDTGRKLQITGDISETDWIHFRLRSSPNVASVHPYQSGDAMLANIPDDLLQAGRRLIVYVYVADADGNKTTIRKEIAVRPRTKPDDYVYTPTEVKHWTDLEIRIKKLEDGGATPEQIGAAVEAYLADNPPTGGGDLQQAVDAYLTANPPIAVVG